MLRNTIILFVLLVQTAIAQTSLEVYVSPTGNDSNSGLALSAPFKTLERARDEIRARATSGPATVWLMDGDYLLTSSFELASQDSGTSSARITYRAVNKHQAKLHLSKVIPVAAFTDVTDPNLISRIDPAASGKIKTVDLTALGVQNMDTWADYFPADNQDLFQIYTDLDGQLPLSRYPNETTMTMESVIQNEGPGIFKYRDDRHERWLEAVNDGLWLQGYWRVAWQYDAVRTASIDTNTKIVTQATSVPGGIGSKYDRPQGSGMEPYIALNLLEEIDREGEWSVNFTTKTLYIWLPETATEVNILDQDIPIFKLEDVSYMDILDLEFDYGLGSAIQINGGYDNLVAGCEIKNFILDAVQVFDGNSHDIVSNDLHHLGAGGIYLSGGSRQTLEHAGHTAVNNHIYEFGRVKVIYAPAIQIPRKYDDNNVGMYVAHNKIHGTPHVGIEFAGNNHIFEYNEIYDICRVSNDMGAFYSWNDWTSYGSVFRYNYIHSSPQAHGMYFDDGDSGDEIHNNIFQGIDVGVFIGGGHDVNAHNNLSVDCHKTVHIDNRGVSRGYNLSNTSMVNRVQSVDYQNPPWSTQYPSIVNILDASYPQDLPNGVQINCNVGINTPTIVDIDAATAIDWGVTLGTNYSDADVSLDEATLAHIAGATAYTGASCVGAIPYSKIGLIDDEYRTVCVDTKVEDLALASNYGAGHHLQTASHSITASSHIENGTDMTFRAGNHITLNPDFEVHAGATFLAEIRDACPPTSFSTPIQSSAYLSSTENIQRTKRILEGEIRTIENGKIQLSYQLANSERIDVFIRDEDGQTVQVLQENVLQNRGVYHLPIDDTNLKKGTYYYTIESEHGGETKAFELSKTKGPAEMDSALEKHPTIFPNPVNDLLTIEFPSGNTKCLIKIVSLEGRVLEECSSFDQKRITLDVSMLVAGMYLINMGPEYYKFLKL